MKRSALTSWYEAQSEDGLAESIRLAEDSHRERNWKRWGLTCRNASGVRFAKTTPLTVTPGTIFLTITRAAAFTGGAKTAFSDGATASAASVLLPLFGMARIPSSRSACSD